MEKCITYGFSLPKVLTATGMYIQIVQHILAKLQLKFNSKSIPSLNREGLFLCFNTNFCFEKYIQKSPLPWRGLFRNAILNN